MQRNVFQIKQVEVHQAEITEMGFTYGNSNKFVFLNKISLDLE